MAGFFDLADPENAALLGVASGLLQAGAPSRLPVPFGLALGHALQAGMLAELGHRLRQAGAATRRVGAAIDGPKWGPHGPAPAPVLPRKPVLLPVSPRGLFAP